MIYDNYGRPVLNLRISVTQKCNMHCPYCHREGESSSSTVMSTEEIVRIAKIAVKLGVTRVKLTGGEPLLRKDILDIVGAIANLQGLADLSMTTNGSRMLQLAKELTFKGLTRVNVSLPTLKPELYHDLMGGVFKDVAQGINAAVKVGLHPVKINMLVLRGVNDQEIEQMIRFAEKTGTVLQLIELEPLNLPPFYYRKHHLDLRVIEEDLQKRALQVQTRGDMQNRKIYSFPRTKVETIHPIENTEFCAHCTRLRVTSDGKLKPCLMRNDNLVDVLTPLREGADDEALIFLFLKAIQNREPYFQLLVPAHA